MVQRVLFLTQWFEPEPTFKGLSFAKALKNQGFEVKVITGFPNYPTGKLYSNYKIKILMHELIDGISVTRVPLYPSHDRSIFRRSANYISFSLSAFLYGIFYAKKTDVIYAYHPPLTVGAAAIGIKAIKQCSVVLDVQDLWPDTLKATGMLNNKKVLASIGVMAAFMYKFCDQIVVLSNGFRDRLLQRGVHPEKVKVIRNWADEKKLDLSVESINFNPNGSCFFNILFAGNIGAAQGLDAVLESAHMLSKENSKIRFIFLGVGLDVNRLKEKAFDRNLQNVIFLPPVPMEQVGPYLKGADVLLVHLKRDDLFKITIPSKMQAYMAVGKPILMAVEGDAAEIVKDAGCGVLAVPENPQSLAEAAIELASMKKEDLQAMGERGLSYYNRELSLLVGCQRFAEVFRLAVKNA